MNEAIVHSGKRGYANLCAYYFGKKGGKAVVFVFIFAQFMACVVYSTLIWSFVSSFIEDFGWHTFTKSMNEHGHEQIDEYASDSMIWRVSTVIPFGILIFPVLMLRNLSGLRYLSLISFLFIMYTIVLAIIQTPWYYDIYSKKPDYGFELFVKPFKIKWLQGIAVIAMSYVCHPLFFNVRKELIISDERRIKKVIVGAIVFMMVVYSLIVVAAYISLGDTFQVPVFTERPTLTPGDMDIPMKIAKGGFLLVVITCIPVNMYPAREQIMSFFKIEDRQRNRVLLTLCLITVAFTIAILYPNVLGLFGIFGGIFASAVGLIIPFLIKIRILEAKYGLKWYSFHKFWYIFIMVTVMTIGSGSVYVSLFNN